MEEMDFVTPPEKHAAVSDGGGEASLALDLIMVRITKK